MPASVKKNRRTKGKFPLAAQACAAWLRRKIFAAWRVVRPSWTDQSDQSDLSLRGRTAARPASRALSRRRQRRLERRFGEAAVRHIVATLPDKLGERRCILQIVLDGAPVTYRRHDWLRTLIEDCDQAERNHRKFLELTQNGDVADQP